MPTDRNRSVPRLAQQLPSGKASPTSHNRAMQAIEHRTVLQSQGLDHGQHTLDETTSRRAVTTEGVLPPQHAQIAPSKAATSRSGRHSFAWADRVVSSDAPMARTWKAKKGVEAKKGVGNRKGLSCIIVRKIGSRHVIWSCATRYSPLSPRRPPHQRGQVVRRPSPAG